MPPKVLTVSEIFWPEGGGAELATRLIVEQLSRTGYEVTVVTGTRKPEPVPGVEFRYTPLLKASNRLVRWGLMEALAQQRWFKELLKSHDVLYVPLAAYPLIPLAKKHGLRVVVHLHNYAPVRYHSVKYYFEPDAPTLSQELKLALYHELYAHRNPARTALIPLSFALYKRSRAWIRQADTIICVSKRQAEIVTKSAPELADKIRVAYNPIPPELVSLKLEKALDEVPTILYVSGDSHVKGFYIIPRVMHILDKKKVKMKFITAGSYRQKNIRMLKNLARKLSFLEVQILGKVDHNKVVELHKTAWALLFPSIIEEPLPYAVVESMALGTVPVASRAGGVLEMLEGTRATELIFQPGNIENIMNRLEILTSMNDSEVIALGNELREKIKSFSNILVSNIITK
ncbi:MAG: glycosyltransferase family 4 protein [Thermofilum sp.]|jgi:glycosyltransferase involved in cell wall biosynthesis|uniref:glycosyltransferase family 4 protein n=1 Tax=Thermofilum sp. TaxID=1961369 RepID=UPI00258E05B6|nr:glycosyltransferase family 4 protein [Thermofilum sp.]MCI4407797.1 glycosyltransferase family 4 protein [Thermofilum sp.]